MSSDRFLLPSTFPRDSGNPNSSPKLKPEAIKTSKEVFNEEVSLSAESDCKTLI
jgi:hypothetical protein